MNCLIFILVFAQYTLLKSEELDPVVDTPLGKIRGNVMVSRKGEPYLAFRGIRYAQPPVDDLRFQAPLPIFPWSDILNATNDGPICYQPRKTKNDEEKMSEDCLFLNIYTKKLYTSAPVMVYIHGGGFYVGNSLSTDTVNPEYLIDTDIVIVSFNYRLGTFGFLSMGTKDYPGNVGFKDQVMVLKWVKEYISNFGGDPNQITLMGHSAGGFSVSLHMISILSRSLFHRAIIMSGAASPQTKFQESQIFLAEKQAETLGCNTSTHDEIIHCLKTVDAAKMANTLYSMFEFGRDNPILLFNAVVEKDYGQAERFLIEDPAQSFKNGDFNNISVMIGLTTGELMWSAMEIARNESLLESFDQNFKYAAPICFLYEKNSPKSLEISQHIKDFYFPNQTVLSEEDGLVIGQMFSDALILFGADYIANHLVEKSDVYFYQFGFPGKYSVADNYRRDGDPIIVEHGDDLIYLFVRNAIAPEKFLVTEPEFAMVDKMTSLWGNFIKNGNPNDPQNPTIQDIEWLPRTKEADHYLNIMGPNAIKMEKNLNKERLALWKQLFLK